MSLHTDWMIEEQSRDRLNRKLTTEEFTQRFGFEPEHDDLDRVNCKDAGSLGHMCCGVCSTHNKPRFICGCLAK
jgi:hypothetical protein